jgi:hypothetical protein
VSEHLDRLGSLFIDSGIVIRSTFYVSVNAIRSMSWIWFPRVTRRFSKKKILISMYLPISYVAYPGVGFRGQRGAFSFASETPPRAP